MSRGAGRVYLPTYRDRHSVKRSSHVFWLEFSHAGKLIRESTKKTIRKDALEVLHRRQTEVKRLADSESLDFGVL
jgi:hypothetical protein